ncbi:MAG TPA: ACT domain-containing protein [Steroidobacteraceae bacterium]|nr:ACT domain-containing protein [Steroidobacteraceae bacterium]
MEKTTRVVVTVIGRDRVGIIAGVAGVLAEAGVNIVDISQTLMQDLFTMIMMVDIAGSSVSFDELQRRLAAKGEQLGMRIQAQREDVFSYMHRV